MGMTTEPDVRLEYRPRYRDYAEAVAAMRDRGGPMAPPSSPAAELMMRPLIWLAGLFGTTKLTITDQGVTTGQGGTEVHHAWSDFNDAFETDNLVCLAVARSGAPLDLPKRCMSPDQLATVRGLIKRRVRRVR
jgi:hypothetical protein